MSLKKKYFYLKHCPVKLISLKETEKKVVQIKV